MLDARPEGCAEGRHCRTCVESVAANLVSICPPLSGKALRQTFFAVYSDPACAPMLGAFERAYDAQRTGRIGPASAMPIRHVMAGAAA